MSADTNPTDLVLPGRRKVDEIAKPNEYHSLEKPGHSKNAYTYFSSVRDKRLVQQDRADRHTVEDPEMVRQSEMSASFTKMTTIKVRTRVHHP